MRGDSQLVINQVMKESNCHDPKMEAYCKLVCRLEDKFDGLELNHIARKFKEAANELVAGEGPLVEPTAGLETPSIAETPSAEPEVMEVDT